MTKLKCLKIFILVVFLSFFGLKYAQAQELNATVIVNADQIEPAFQSIFVTLQRSMTDFLNNRRWTDMTFTNQERIECTFNLVVRRFENNVVSAELTVQSRRPVFNSSYFSPLFNFRDTEIEFEYNEHDQLEFIDNAFGSNLTAILAYYAYIIIGYDMDSFSRLGGTPYFRAAENIVALGQSSNYGGWRAELGASRNRHALVSNLLDEAFRRYRNFFYEYHLLGLDQMTINMTNARARISEGLPILREANRARPTAVVIGIFLDTKADELVNIFSEATQQERERAVEILSDIAPTRSAQWERINRR